MVQPQLWPRQSVVDKRHPLPLTNPSATTVKYGSNSAVALEGDDAEAHGRFFEAFNLLPLSDRVVLRIDIEKEGTGQAGSG